MNRCKPFSYVFRINCWAAQNTHNRSAGLRPHLPDMKINDRSISRLLNQFTNLFSDMIICLIEQYTRSHPHQRPSPARNDNCTHNPHCRIEPYPAKVSTSKQCCDGQNRSQCICNDVNVSRAQIIVVTMRMVRFIVAVVMPMVMIMTTRQQKRAHHIHC
ncbi:hypothetical protein VC36_21105 [Pseudomonas marginalis]|nr:hypothetical protein VC36_21105 [Pseudomonas marginalis]KJZ58756.1 hypothetical protein VC37_00635 [Pseudomonas marginalis]